MDSDLRISDGLTLSSDYVTKTGAILAQRRKGKTYTASVFAEEFIRIKQPFVALDPTGAWWGLRASADNDEDGGLPAVVLGGQHGHAPLPADSGGYIADFVLDRPGYYVLDLSLLETRQAERQFAYAFANRLHRRKMQPGMDFPLHLFVDEADLFVPQDREAGDNLMLGAFQSIVRRGGLHGLGSTLISQRPALVNKSVLTQLDVLILLRLVAGQDQDAVDKSYIKRAGTAEQRQAVMSSLASLSIGEAWIWEPGSEPALFERIRIRPRRTFNSSATPKPGEHRVEPTKFAKVDLDAIETAMRAAIDKAKAEDPAELRKELKAVEAARDAREALLASARKALVATGYFTAEQVDGDVGPRIVELYSALSKAEPERVEVPVLTEEAIAAVEAVIARWDKAFDDAAEYVNVLLDALKAARQGLPAGAKEGQASVRRSSARQDQRADTPTSDAASTPRQSVPPVTEGKARAEAAEMRPPSPPGVRLSEPQERILDVLAEYAAVSVAEPTRGQVAWKAGVSPRGSGYEKNLGALRSAGLVAYPKPGLVMLTPEGAAVAAPVRRPASTSELQEQILRLVSKPQAAILRVIIDAYPDRLSRTDIAEAVGVSSQGSGFEKNLGTLRSLGLIEYPAAGYVVGTSQLFVGDVAA